MECMRQYISDVLDFVADMHTLTKLKVRGLHALISQGGQDGEAFVGNLSRQMEIYPHLER